MRLGNILDKFEGKSILVLGDLMLDKFIWGDVSRISPEAPVPIVHVTSQSIKLGGAANAANNLRSLGAKVFIAGVVGEDTIGGELLEELKIKGINTEGVVIDRKRPTTLKTRVISLNQQVIRLDKESREEISDPISNKILDYVEEISSKVDGVIISDYGKGVITYEVLKSISEMAKINEVPVVVDPDLRNFLDYSDITVFISNQRDVTEVLGIRIINETSLRNIGYKLISSLCCEGVVITQGKEGLIVFDKEGNLTHIPAIPRDVFDVTGVSDTVTSTFTLALTSGADLVEAAKLANYAGWIVVGKVGTATVDIDEIKEVLNERESD